MDDKEYAGKRILTPVLALRCLIDDDDDDDDDDDHDVCVRRCRLQNMQSATKYSCHEAYRIGNISVSP
jgi:hypothetical protein